MQKKWILKTSKNEAKLKKIVPEISTTILANRGIEKQTEIEEIVKPEYLKHLHDPFLMTDMEKAVKRILQAINKDEKILIYGDYDADGVPASAVLASFFNKINFTNFSVYIPDRHTEQYGLSIEVVEKFAKEKVQLIITVDCGISNVLEAKKAKELGVDLIITDHHLVPEKIPKALAVVDPKRPKDKYPFKELSGTGVAFKLVQGLIAKGNFTDVNEGWEKWLLDLVAIATVADMMPIVGENKTLVKFGLMVLKKTKRPGLLVLFKSLKLKREYISEEDIGFMIGPRINSAGRMSHALEAFNLLMTEKEEEAVEIAKHLELKNGERKDLVIEILKTVEEKYREKKLPKVIVCGNEDWGLGVLGLAAARISEKYNRPTFVWAKNGDGKIKGSCRSDGHINVVELMRKANETEFFTDLGGHDFAGGFSLLAEKLEDLEEALNTAYEKIDKVDIVQEIEVDLLGSLDQMNLNTYKELDKIGPFGIDFPKPVWWFKNLEIASVKEFGKLGGHLEIEFKDIEGVRKSGIGFFACEPKADLTDSSNHIWPGVTLIPGRKVELLANLELSTFKYRPEIRLKIVDLRAG